MGAAQQIEGVGINVTADGAIPQYSLVTLGADGADGYPEATLATAAASATNPIYQLTRRADAAGDQLTAIGMHRQETFILIAAGAITAGDLVGIGATDGRVEEGVGATVKQFQALTDASGAGKYVECAPILNPKS